VAGVSERRVGLFSERFFGKRLPQTAGEAGRQGNPPPKKAL
jgi:hypothetical protein